MNKKSSSELNTEEQVPSMEKVTINYLNDDCLINIFEFLTMEEKLRLELVSKRWNGVAKRSWTFEKTFNLNSVLDLVYIKYPSSYNKSNKSERTNFVIKILDRCGKYLNKVLLHSYNSDCLEYSPILKKLSEHGSNIQYLIISDYNNQFPDEDLRLLFSAVNLHSLEINDYFINSGCLATLKPDCIREIAIRNLYTNYSKKNSPQVFFSNLNNLTKVKIDSNYEIIDMLATSKCQSIRNFSIIEGNHFPNQEFFRPKLLALIARQKNICNINLGTVPIAKELINGIPPEHLTTLELSFKENKNLFNFNSFEKLTTLITHNISLTKYDLLNLNTALYIKELCIYWSKDLKMYKEAVNCFKNFQYLEKLKIFHLHNNICIDILIEDILSCESLKQLILYHCTFTSRGIKNVKTIPNIIKLKAHSKNSEDRALEDFVDKAPKLQELDVSHLELTNLLHRIDNVKRNRGDNHILKITHSFCPELKLKIVPSSILLCKR